jgi:hypothetical protein
VTQRGRIIALAAASILPWIVGLLVEWLFPARVGEVPSVGLILMAVIVAIQVPLTIWIALGLERRRQRVLGILIANHLAMLWFFFFVWTQIYFGMGGN